MHTVTFHNLGNADCTRINLNGGRKILFDYANMRDPNDHFDLRCDLPRELRTDLGKRDYFDVVAFWRLDRDQAVQGVGRQTHHSLPSPSRLALGQAYTHSVSPEHHET